MVTSTVMVLKITQMVKSMKESSSMVYKMDTVLNFLLMAIVILGSLKMAKYMGKEQSITILVFMLAITMSVIGTKILSMIGAYSLPTAS